MNPAFLELLSSCEPSAYDEASIGRASGHVNTFAVNHLGDIVIIASDGRLKHSNIRSHPRLPRTTTDHQEGQRQQLEDIELHGLLRDDVVGFTHLEYSSNNDLLMWSSTAAGVVATNGVHQETDRLSSSFRYIKIWDKLQDNGELRGNGIIKATFHPLSPYHVVILFDNNTLQLVDYRSMDIQVIPLSKRFSSGAFTSFSFGPNIDWLKFTVLLLTTNGDVYTLCPIIPLGAVVSVSAVMELWDGFDQLVDDDDGCNRSNNDRYYLQYVQRYLTDIFGERSSHGLVGEASSNNDDTAAIIESMFVRAGESYENQHGDQLGISNYTPQLVGPIVIQRDSYEQLVGDGIGSNGHGELKMSEPRPHGGTANDICVPGNSSNDTSLQHPVGGAAAPVVAISYSTGVVDLMVFDASSQVRGLYNA